MSNPALRELLEGMTKPELIKYGNATYGLSLTAKYTNADLINAIEQSAAKFQLNSSIKTGTAIEDKELPPGMAKIQLHRTELNKGEKSAIVGINGKLASLPIGAKFWCPIELINVLNDAMRLEYELDRTTEPPELIAREVHTYPFTVFQSVPHTEESAVKAAQKWGWQPAKVTSA